MDLDELLPDFMKSFKKSIYSYTDGSNNSYYVSKDLIEYDPISPMMSNTGEYSGGPPAKKSINKEQLKQIQIAFELATADTENHLKNRPKGSGTISIDSTGQTFVLKRGANSISKIENLLIELLNRP